MSIFSGRLQQLKKENNLLQKDIANNIGVSLRAYQYYEQGKKEPTMSNLISIADFFNTSIDFLVGRTDNPHINK